MNVDHEFDPEGAPGSTTLGISLDPEELGVHSTIALEYCSTIFGAWALVGIWREETVGSSQILVRVSRFESH